MYKSAIFFFSYILIVSIASAEIETSNKFTINGDSGERFYNGEVLIFGINDSKLKAMGKPSNREEYEKILDIFARGKVKNGRFHLEGEIEKPQKVSIEFQATSKDGFKMGTIKGLGFILEPGQLEMSFIYGSQLLVKGGKYQDIVINSWLESAEYAAIKKTMADMIKKISASGLERGSREHSEAFEPYNAVQSESFAIENAMLEKVATTHPDVLARILAMKSVWLFDKWMVNGFKAILELDPENTWAKQAYDDLIARSAKDVLRKPMAYAKDFDARDLDGNTVSLKSVRQNNKYVLLEFWASWCGPCRNEIPHMKRVYAQYHDKGLEIMSFTIDHNKDAWIEASAEEKIPWLNTGMGREAEPKKMYGITGVPANFLVEAETGRIIAQHLRGHKLDEKLEELLE